MLAVHWYSGDTLGIEGFCVYVCVCGIFVFYLWVMLVMVDREGDGSMDIVVYVCVVVFWCFVSALWLYLHSSISCGTMGLLWGDGSFALQYVSVTDMCVVV